MRLTERDLPEGWVETTLADLLADGVFADGDWVETKDQDPSGAVRLIQLADVGDGQFRDRSSRFLTVEKARELNCTLLERNDVLVARMPEPLGRACIFPGVGQPAVTAVDVCIVRPNPTRAQPSWLVHAINSPEFRRSMTEFVRGTTRQRISRRNLGSLTLAVPPLDDQLRTAAWLDEVGERRASIVDRLTAAGVTVSRLRAAVLAAACAGRLTADWREDNPDADPAEETLRTFSGQQRRRAVAVNVDLALPDLPASYLTSSIGAANERIQYGTSRRAATDGDIPVLRMTNIQNGAIDATDLKYLVHDDEVNRLLLADGDLLFNRTNSPELVGKTAVFHSDWPATFASYLIRVRLDPRVATPDFVGLWLNSGWGRMWAHHVKTDGVSQSNINGTKLAAMPLPLPPLAEQHEIVRRATAALRVADRLDSAISVANAALDGAMKGAVVKAFRGELVPTEVQLATARIRDDEQAAEASNGTQPTARGPRSTLQVGSSVARTGPR